jgi:ribosomal protein S21
LPKLGARGIILSHMAINAEVVKNEGENATNLIRRFSKRVQGVGLIQGMRKRRYYTRTKSAKVQRKHALKVIRRREEIQDLIKMGKLVERMPGDRRPSKR